MNLFYLDSSAWVKRYFIEPGSDGVSLLFQRAERLASTALGYVEVTSALARQHRLRRTGEVTYVGLRNQLMRDWTNFIQLPLSEDVTNLAASIAHRYQLRGADSVHLAAVVRLRETDSDGSVVLVSSDQEMLTAAAALDVSIEDPAARMSG